ncbi:SCO6745 family protein [Streptomyces zingiberis]|uniref:SalK n=1 Tax=Streptomyces zingiberis TaxID=2053010 RepID=A0ABX1C7T2_9ACTN|nr:hypothetical protein [Streptomyces zingiberis]NJQ03922.1 hypothetical protein [Streptomyces zingiberis]
MTTTSPSPALPRRAGRTCHNAVNPLHSVLYFSPDLLRESAAIGLDSFAPAYLAFRAAPLGAVGAGVVTSTFNSFKHDLVARHVPAVWETASPAAALAARLRAVDATLRRVLGDDVVTSPEMAEAAGLALRAAEACDRTGRPLYSAHADLPVPEEPHLALWHAATLLREHRGDGHIALLLHAELSPVESVVTHSASGRGMRPEWAMRIRGWTAEDWSEAEARLRDRGLLDAAGELTPEGAELRKTLEEETDRLDHAPYEHLGAAGVERLTELASAWRDRALSGGAFPADLFGKG